MKISKNRIRYLIRESIKKIIINEWDSGVGDFISDDDSDSVAQQSYNFAQSDISKTLNQTAAEIVVSLTPAGFLIDLKDLYLAYNEQSMLGITFAGVGFIPIFGDLLKGTQKLKNLEKAAAKVSNISVENANKIKKISDDVNDLKKTAEEGADEVIKILDSCKNPVIKNIDNVIVGIDEVKSSLKSVIKEGNVYHIHTVNNPKMNDDVIKNGVALKQNRSGIEGEFRATTYHNEMTGDKGIESLRAAPFGLGTNGKITIIYELPTGATLNDISTPLFTGTQGGSSYGEFIANIDPQYMKAVVNRTGESPVLTIYK